MIEPFIHHYYDNTSPLVLAFSGGPDSLALLHMVKHLPLHVAHVDHGWRAESGAQAQSLQAYVEALGLPFYLHTLKERTDEEGARRARLAFFRQIYDAVGAQAVLLGHQSDDQAETVLKRVLEAAYFPAMGGMKEVSSYEGMTLWRPLLHIPKHQLPQYPEAIFDETNKDPKFLRGRMRTTLLPLLREQFGKGVERSLVRLGARAQQLTAYMDERVAKLHVLRSPLGLCFDTHGLAPFEAQWWIRRELAKAQLPTPLDAVFIALEENKANCSFGNYQVDRGYLFYYNGTPWLERRGVVQRGWKELFRGELVVPEEVQLALPRANMALSWSSKTLGEWWSDHKVPAFLRGLVPVAVEGQVCVAEFLT